MNRRKNIAMLGAVGVSILALAGCGKVTAVESPTPNIANTSTNQAATANTLALGKPLQQATNIQMTDPKNGWLLTAGTNRRVLYTGDGGRTWSDVTPESPLEKKARYVQLADSINNTSAVVIVRSETNGQQTFLYQTTDAGRHWQQMNLPKTVQKGELNELQFATSKTGWVAITPVPATAAATPAPIFLRTSDGGSHWSIIHTNGAAGWPHNGSLITMDGSSSATSIWAAASRGQSYTTELFTSADQGRSWRRIVLPDPFGASAGQQPGPHISSVKFFGAKRGIVVEYWPAMEDMPPTEVALLSTQDGGLHWQASKVLYLPSRQQSGMTANVQVLGPKDVIVISGTTVYHTTDGGRLWSSIKNTSTLPSLWQVYFINGDIAFGSAKGTPVRTTDGGRTWHAFTGLVLHH